MNEEHVPAIVQPNTAPAVPQQGIAPEVMEKVLIVGDLASLTAAQRADYYGAVCRSLGLNPLTKPFEYLNLNGKLRLYALRDCADQLRRLHGVSIYIVNREHTQDIYIVTARAKDQQGREDESTGAVPVANLKGDALANALMKAETKAKRRVTLSIAGLGWLDESEIETIPQTTRGQTADDHPTTDQVSALVELARACGVNLPDFGKRMRELMQLSDDTKITKKFLHGAMTLEQYEQAWRHYNELLQQQVEQDIDDHPPPSEGKETVTEGEIADAPKAEADASPSPSTASAASSAPAEASLDHPTVADASAASTDGPAATTSVSSSDTTSGSTTSVPSTSTDKPAKKLTHQEAIFRIQTRTHELVPDRGPTGRADRIALWQHVFGTAIDGWTKVVQLPLSALRGGAEKLMAMQPEQPPDVTDDDIPATVEDDTVLPPEPPEMGDDGYVKSGSVEELRLWAEMMGEAETLMDILKTCPGYPHDLQLTASQYARARNAVEWAASHREKEPEGELL